MRFIAGCLAAFAALSVQAQPLPRAASPEAAGFSAEGLARIDRFWDREIAENRVPGAVVAIARDGKLVYYKAFGFLDKDKGVKMPLDAMFSLASMTKPMVGVTALTLTEEGRLPLKSRVEEYFPAFANQQVGMVGANTDAKPEKAGSIYVQDLFRHTSGIVYGARGDTPLHKMYPPSSAGASTTYTADEFVAKLASLPLVHKPGTVWEYSLSIDLLGVLVEKVAGTQLEDLMKQRLWSRLGMKETTFHPSDAQRQRLARPLPVDPLTGKPQRIAMLDANIKFDCGGGCGFGTVADYVRFGQMLLDGGTLEGQRILAPKTVAYMTSDHLGAAIKNNVAVTEPQRAGYGFGLTVAVRTEPGIAAVPGTVGDYSWNGANGTSWWNDPKERLVVVVGTAAPGDIRKTYRERISALVYGAMTRLH